MFVPNKVRSKNKTNSSNVISASNTANLSKASNDYEMDDVMMALLAAKNGLVKKPNTIQVAPRDNPNKRVINTEVKPVVPHKISKVEPKIVQHANIVPAIMFAPPPPPPPLPVSSTVLTRDLEMATHARQVHADVNRVVSKSAIRRTAGGQIWEDATMADWDKSDYRVFVGNLGYEASDDLLVKTFGHFPSFKKAKVVRDKKTGRCKGFGFISFGNADDYIKATKEFNGKYVGNRPIKLQRSSWQKRQLTEVRKEEKKKQKLEKLLQD